MDDLDRILAKLAGAPLPDALDWIDEQVLARIAGRANGRGVGFGVGLATTVAALVIGMVGAELPLPNRPGVSIAPLGDGASLAPSTLLLGRQ